jgi:hypothetical protein
MSSVAPQNALSMGIYGNYASYCRVIQKKLVILTGAKFAQNSINRERLLVERAKTQSR